jgi:hypothetical protein
MQDKDIKNWMWLLIALFSIAVLVGICCTIQYFCGTIQRDRINSSRLSSSHSYPKIGRDDYDHYSDNSRGRKKS